MDNLVDFARYLAIVVNTGRQRDSIGSTIHPLSRRAFKYILGTEYQLLLFLNSLAGNWVVAAGQQSSFCPGYCIILIFELQPIAKYFLHFHLICTWILENNTRRSFIHPFYSFNNVTIQLYFFLFEMKFLCSKRNEN